MPQIDCNFTLSYCRRWGVEQAVREVVQNWQDVRLLGGTGSVEHRGDVLTLTSDGQHMTSRALVFGASDKSGDDRTIGQFGDGLKVALGVFLRHNMQVKINTGREVWTPCVVNRDGERVVGVNTRALPTKQHRERVVFEISGVSAADWALWQRNFLFLAPAAEITETTFGTILHDADRQGHIFSKGILVERRNDDSMSAGYDLPALELNRDREVADSWQVESLLRRVWQEATHAPTAVRARQALYALLESPEQREVVVSAYSVAQFAGTPTALAVAEQFRADHGAAIPVATSSEAQEAAQHGQVGVLVPPTLLNLLRAGGVTDLAGHKASVREDVRATYNADSDLTPREYDILQSALSLFGDACQQRGECLPVVEVVDFTDESLLGLYAPQADKVLLARIVLAERRTTYAILAHEIAHRHGADGDAGHRLAIEDLMGRVSAALVG